MYPAKKLLTAKARLSQTSGQRLHLFIVEAAQVDLGGPFQVPLVRQSRPRLPPSEMLGGPFQVPLVWQSRRRLPPSCVQRGWCDVRLERWRWAAGGALVEERRWAGGGKRAWFLLAGRVNRHVGGI